MWPWQNICSSNIAEIPNQVMGWAVTWEFLFAISCTVTADTCYHADTFRSHYPLLDNVGFLHCKLGVFTRYWKLVHQMLNLLIKKHTIQILFKSYLKAAQNILYTRSYTFIVETQLANVDHKPLKCLLTAVLWHL